MPCATMFLNLLSQVGRLTSVSVLAEAYHLSHQTVMPFSWVLAQNALRHHGHGRLSLLYQTPPRNVKPYFVITRL